MGGIGSVGAGGINQRRGVHVAPPNQATCRWHSAGGRRSRDAPYVADVFGKALARIRCRCHPRDQPRRSAPSKRTRSEMTQGQQQGPRAVTTSSKSADRSTEHDHSSPQSPRDVIRKSASEAGAEHGFRNKIAAVGRELDRNIGGEYERREDQTPPKRRADRGIGKAGRYVARTVAGTSVRVPKVSRRQWLAVVAVIVVLAAALVTILALNSSPSKNLGQRDRQYTIAPVQPH